MPRFLAAALCLIAALPLGCEENLDPTTPEGAQHQLRDAVMAQDTAAILARTSAATHTGLAELHTLLKEQRRAIAEKYPEEHRAAAHAAYPEGVLAAADTNALFAALVGARLEALEPSPGLRHGLTVMGVPAVDAERASVSVQSGETIEFVREDGKWVTTAFELPVRQNLARARLDQQTLTKNLKAFEELKRRAAAKEAKEAAAAPETAGAPADAAAPSQSP